MFDNLQKISLLSVESLFFSTELLLILKHLEKVTLVLTPSPLLKCHSYSHIQNLIFFLRPPPFLHNVTLFTDFFLKSSLMQTEWVMGSISILLIGSLEIYILIGTNIESLVNHGLTPRT